MVSFTDNDKKEPRESVDPRGTHIQIVPQWVGDGNLARSVTPATVIRPLD